MEQTVAMGVSPGVVYCPHCGKTDQATENGRCRHCRADLSLVMTLDGVASVYREAGRKSMMDGRPADAARSLLVALDLTPDDLELRVAAGEALARAGDTERARKLLESVPGDGESGARARSALQSLDGAESEKARLKQTMPMKAVGKGIGLTALGAALVLAGLLTSSLSKPAPEALVASALKTDALAYSLAVKIRTIGDTVVLVGQLPSDEARAAVLAAASRTGHKLDATQLTVAATLPQVVNAVCRANNPGMRAMRWDTHSGVLTVAGSVPDQTALESLARALAREGAEGIDMSGVRVASRVFVVKDGDSLWRIAQYAYGNGSMYSRLRRKDGGIPDPAARLLIGEVIVAPGASTAN